MFGAMILGQEPAGPTPAGHLIGWAYHFSNGMTFGVMYVALLGARPWQRHWLWGVAFACVLELGMLFTPYPARFGIGVGPACVRAWSGRAARAAHPSEGGLVARAGD
jgi:hypothetical protein